MAWAELIIFTQIGCPHCESVKVHIDKLKSQLTDVSHVILDPNPAKAQDRDHQLAERLGIISVPAAVIIENNRAGSPYLGTQHFSSGKIFQDYTLAQSRNPQLTDTAPIDQTNTTGTTSVPPLEVDPGLPTTGSDPSKILLKPAAIVLGLIIAGAFIFKK